MQKTDRTRWGLCFGLMGTMVVAGLAVASASRPARADGPGHAVIGQQQTPRPTPGGNLVATGRVKFDRACGRCHPGGEEDVGPRLTNINWAEERMAKQIRSGGGRMRAIPPTKLPDADLPALMAYMRTIHAVR